MTLLIAGGDSFTWGSELPGCTGKRASNLTWAALYAQQQGREYVCVAKPGCGNGAITRRLINEIASRDTTDAFVLAMWTFPGRYEVSIDPAVAKDVTRLYTNTDVDGTWITISPWQTIPVAEKKIKMGVGDDPTWNYWLDRQQEDYDRYGINDLSRSYYSIVTRESQIKDTLIAMYTMQSFLKDSNIPYRFAAVTQEIFDILESDHPLAKKIDRSRWLGNSGMLEWSKNRNYPISAMQHPGLEAHEAWVKDHAL